MLDGSEHYVVLKLISGEQVMAVLREEDEECVLLETPMCIRTIPILDANREAVTAAPLCQFSDDKTFVIYKRDILFCKNLHHVFVNHYRKIVEEHANVSFIKEGVQERITTEEAKRRISMLEELAKTPKDEEEERRYRVFIEGNDTIN